MKPLHNIQCLQHLKPCVITVFRMMTNPKTFLTTDMSLAVLRSDSAERLNGTCTSSVGQLKDNMALVSSCLVS
jgi:hypothetical protein